MASCCSVITPRSLFLDFELLAHGVEKPLHARNKTPFAAPYNFQITLAFKNTLCSDNHKRKA